MLSRILKMESEGPDYQKQTFDTHQINFALGFIGVFLPYVLIFSNWMSAAGCPPILDSISSYYHSPSRPVFTMLLLAVAYFFIVYKGYNIYDLVISKVAGVSLLFVVMFPTNIDDPVNSCFQCTESVFMTDQACSYDRLNIADFRSDTQNSELLDSLNGEDPKINSGVSLLHYGSAAVFFVCLFIFSWFLFTKSDRHIEKYSTKWYRNSVFRVCGVVILLSVLLIVFSNDVSNTLVFWAETVAVNFFGIAWLVKSQKVYGAFKEE